MSIKDLVDVTYDLSTRGVSTTAVESFGIPAFIGAHRWFLEDYREFTSLDFFPTYSQDYIALRGFLSPNPKPARVLMVRREADAILTVDGSVATDVEFRFNLQVDAVTPPSLVSYTAEAGDTAEEVFDALKSVIEADTTLDASVTATIVGTGATATLQLAPKPGMNFAISALSKLKASFVATEDLEVTAARLVASGANWEVLTAHDHTETSVLALAAYVETLVGKRYRVALGGISEIQAPIEPPVSISGKLASLGYDRTSVMFHEEADTLFPETTSVATFITIQPGKTSLVDKPLVGFGPSRNPVTKNPLSETEMSYLKAKNVDYLEALTPSITILKGGKTASGQFVRVLSSADFIVAQVERALLQKFLIEDVVLMSDADLGALKSLISTVASRYVESDVEPNILDRNRPFDLDFPSASSLSFAEIASGEYLRAKATFYIAGAMYKFKFHINFTYNAQDI